MSAKTVNIESVKIPGKAPAKPLTGPHLASPRRITNPLCLGCNWGANRGAGWGCRNAVAGVAVIPNRNLQLRQAIADHEATYYASDRGGGEWPSELLPKVNVHGTRGPIRFATCGIYFALAYSVLARKIRYRGRMSARRKMPYTEKRLALPTTTKK